MPRVKCRGCGDRFDLDQCITVPLGFFHSIECASAYSKEKAERQREKQRNKVKKEVKQRWAREKKAHYDNDLKTRKSAAKKACHAYIRARDKNEDCICCGRQLGEKYDAGHFLESGNNPIIRYHEDNIHSQSVYCNQYQGGNSDDYEGRLRKKIGDERVDYLLASKGGTVKRTAQDYKEIENYYKAKLKELTDA